MLHEYKTFKNSFKNVCTDTNTIQIIEDLCLRTNTIIKYTYYFLKLYLTHLFNSEKVFPHININFIRYIYTFVSTIKSSRECKTEIKDVINFNNKVFSKFNLPYKSRDGLTNILSYESETIVTCIENNIKENFAKRFNKYINILLGYNEEKKRINKSNSVNKKEEIKELNKKLRIIKDEILSRDNITNVENKEFIEEQRNKLFSHISNIRKGKVLYDIEVEPQKYLYSMFAIIKEYEKINENIGDDESEEEDEDEDFNICKKKIKLYNVMPMRTTLIPKYVTIDTEIIIQNFKDKLKENLDYIGNNCKCIEDLRRNFKKNNIQQRIWEVIFNMKIKYFKDRNKYKFEYLLKTDGIACSATFKIKDIYNDNVTKKKINIKESTQYIEDVLSNNRFGQLIKRPACIDPNKRDTIYCGTHKNNKLETFRYTQCQRNVETKSKKYKKIRTNLQKSEKIEIKVKKKKEKKNIKELELEKTNYTRKSVSNTKNIEYISNVEKINNIIEKHYENKIYRKLNWNSFMNREKSESKMIKNFEKKIGNNKEVVVIIGDYSCRSCHLKGTVPVISKKIIKIYKRYGYETYLIDEFNTSKLCNKCGCELEKFMKRKSKNPKHKGKEILVNGLLRCQSVTHNCQIIHNRDTNSVENMLKITYELMKKGKRPTEYTKDW